MTNALRHADAKLVDVSLRHTEGQVVLTVRDDGRGLPESLSASAGVAGMRERAMLVGAELEIGSHPDAGVEGRLVVARCRGWRMTTPLKTQVLLADDHAVVRSGLRTVLDAEPDIEVVAEAADGAEAVQKALAPSVNLAILDVSMPRMTGLQAAARAPPVAGPTCAY